MSTDATTSSIGPPTIPPADRLADGLQPWLFHTPLSSDDRERLGAFFREHGFAVVRGLLDTAAVEGIDAELTALQDRQRRHDLPARHTAPELEAETPTIIDEQPFFNYLVYATQVAPFTAAAIADGPIAELAPQLLDEPSYLYDYDRHGVVYFDARARSSYRGLVWHPDWESTPELPIWPAVAFTIHLDATSADNGFLRFLPGSHRVPPSPRPEGYEKISTEVGVTCERGDVLFHHSHAWHAATRPSNDAAIRRHLRGKWCTGEPLPPGAWSGRFDNSATRASTR